ncbi:MAG: ABC transporter permease subunit, partial [Prevotella sp.]
MMKTTLTIVALALATSVSAQESPLWMRYCAISPDGSAVAFTYKGDIYTVPTTGGTARQLTTNAAYDTHPVWSPDSKQLAFCSNREGSMDVYVMQREGGTPRRLTTNSNSETPIAFKDNNTVLYTSSIMPSAKSIIFANRMLPQVYEVGTNGSRPHLFSALPMMDISIRPNGDLLYHDQKGYEDPWRKHHRSPITRDIWLRRGGKYTKLTNFNGEDRTPVWAAQGDTFYYLSEEDGTFNVYVRNIDGTGKQQLTRHTTNPVRFLTAANNGTLCYGYDGEIYTLKQGEQPQKLKVNIVTDKIDTDLDRQTLFTGATEIALSPDGKELAFVLHGDVYVTSNNYRTTKQITNTPEQEREIQFAPDGRSIVYASERGGLWQIYRTKLKLDKEKSFAYATQLEEEQLVKSDRTSQQPRFSPDGKSIAFFEDRSTLRVLDIKSKAVRTVMDGKFVYSYSDGDISFAWSPDSRWLLSSYIGVGGWNSPDVALVKADGKGEIHNLTQSGYSDVGPRWVLGGKAMLLIFVFVYKIPLFPSGGVNSVPVPEGIRFVFDRLQHLALPILTLVLLGFWSTAYVIRNLVLGTLQEDFIMSARARGIPEKKVLHGHTLRTSAPPLVTMILLSFLASMSGSIIYEGIFSWPGLGQLYWIAVQQNDIPVLMGDLAITTGLYQA